MPTFIDLIAEKPAATLNRELNIHLKDFFKSLAKGAIAFSMGNAENVSGALVDATGAVSFKDNAEHAAWALIVRAIQQAMMELIQDYVEFFPESLADERGDTLADTLARELDELVIAIDERFFEQPDKQTFVEELKAPVEQWLIACGVNEAAARSITARFSHRFVLSLHREWLKNPTDYAIIEQKITSPFFTANKIARGWTRYRAWLQEQPKQRMFDEAFSLHDVFVPLRAYYEEEAEEDKAKKDTDSDESNFDKPHIDSRHPNKKRKNRVVVDLNSALIQWVQRFDKDSPLCCISGGPGSGKSSSAKVFAADVAAKLEEIHTVFIPLHHFKYQSSLMDAMATFQSSDSYLHCNPLDPDQGPRRLLLIFDGLDELSMRGQGAQEAAQDFVDEVANSLSRFNDQGRQIQGIITGRDLSIQSAERKLRGRQKIYYALPYFVSELNRIKENYVDPNNLLDTDQRDQWWRNFANAKQKNVSAPKEIKNDQLTPITKEPLLNYLVALSVERGKIDFSSNTTLNTIYADLLNSVYERQHEGGRKHKGTADLKQEEFTLMLEEIALAVWHGHGRTASVSAIIKQCEASGLANYLERFTDSAKSGVTALLTAFYFRMSEHSGHGEDTFEFTHKSFGEYLIARRIVEEVKVLSDELERRENNPKVGKTPMQALEGWLHICGPTPIDDYILSFLRDEIGQYSKEECLKWQTTFIHLLQVAISNGSPGHKLQLEHFQEIFQRVRNAEEALLVIHSACAHVTDKVIEIRLGESATDFGDWLKRTSGQREGPANKAILYCLNHLDLSSTTLDIIDLHKALLKKTKFNNAKMRLAIMATANLAGADLEGADLGGADLEGADLEGADLEGADLKRADLEWADLKGADLKGADLKGADLKGADLKRADLKGADLKGADLKRADLKRADLKRADLKRADLAGADLKRAVLKGANLEGANLEGAITKNTILGK